MCGICGFAGFNQQDGKSLRLMAKYLDHRGPDDEGYFEDELAALAHKRLSIIDIESGHQPMFSADKRYVIVYNGETYNFLELRKHLEKKGYLFKSRSDTEVVLLWMVEYGTEGLSDLNGMFAISLWDRHEQTLLLARDRLGIKPLYFLEQNSGIYFSSEIKAILPFLYRKEPNLHAIYEFMTFQNMLSGQTFFKHIQKLQPGTWLTWSPTGKKQGTYWDISFSNNHNYLFEDCLEEYKSILEKAVKRHLIADVPVGVYLSGGFDSSSISVIAAEQLDQPLQTFTGAFTDSDYYDERAGSRLVAQSIQAISHEVEIKPIDYLQNIGKVIYHLDEPTLGTGAFPQYMVSKLASQSVKVVLTGHGGDEMFAGYQVNKAALLKEVFKNRPLRIIQTLLGIRKDEWTRVLYFLIYPLFCKGVKHGIFIMTPPKKRTSLFDPEFLDQNKDFDPFDSLDAHIDGKGFSHSEELLVLYLKTYLPTLFMQEDKISMANSIESRTPLCDNELLDIALKYPLHIKLKNNSLKALTKKAMKGRLPKALYRLPKRGFPTPFARWFREEPLKSFMQDLLLDDRTKHRGIFNSSYIRKIFEKNNNSRTDLLYDYVRANQLYSSSIVELWFRTFIDTQSPRPVI